MLRWLILCIVALCGARANGQGMFSVNTIGYINFTMVKGWNLVIGQLRPGTGGFQGGTFDCVVYYQTNGGWQSRTYLKGEDDGDVQQMIGNGRPLFVYMYETATYTHVGEVPVVSERRFDAGLTLTGSIVPIGGKLEQMGLQPQPGFGIFKLRPNGTYESFWLDDFSQAWTPRTPEFAAGEAFWIYTPTPLIWRQDFAHMVAGARAGAWKPLLTK